MRAAAIAFAMAWVAYAHAQPAPPRTILDVKALLETYQPDTKRLDAARAVLARKPPASRSADDLVRYYLERANAASQLSLTEERLESARRAAEFAPAWTWMQQRALNELANAEGSAGNLMAQLKAREASRERFKGDSGNRISDNKVVATIYADLGDLRAGRRLLAESEGIFARMTGEHYLWRENLVMLLEDQRGALLTREGRYAEAEAAYHKALAAGAVNLEQNKERAKRGWDTPTQSIFETHQTHIGLDLAWAILMQGRPVEAEFQVRESLTFALVHTGATSPEAARAVATLAQVLLEQNRLADAEAIARAGVNLYLKSGVGPASTGLASARARLGTILVMQSKFAEALLVFEERVAGLRQDAALMKRFGTDQIEWAIALLNGGRPADAATMLERMRRFRLERQGHDHPETALRAAFHALAVDATGDRAAARAELRQALPILLEEARTERARGIEGVIRQQRLRWLIEGALKMISDPEAPSSEAIAEGFRMADIARGSGVQRAVAASAARAAIREPKLAALARREQDLGNRVTALSDILAGVLARPPEQQLPKVVADMRRDIDAMRAERAALRKQIQQGFRDYAELVEPQPVTLEATRALLGPKEALVSIYSAPERIYVWGLSAKGVVFKSVPIGAAALGAKVAELRGALDAGELELARFPRYDLALAREVYELLLAPVKGAWEGAENLLVVPHGALGQLPFALLVTADSKPAATPLLFAEYRSVPWLLRQTAVTQLPSVSTLSTLRRAAVPAQDRLAFAGFGDPVFSPAGGAPSAARGVGLRNLSVGRRDERGAERAFNGLANLASLPDTAPEIREIASLLGAQAERDVFLGARASETNVKTQDLSKRRVIAFATHGLVPGDLNGLVQPALALSNPALTGEKDADGLLLMDEILSLKLDADWVVLSACNTASADGAGVEAVSGLGRAFFYAGARALLVSNWPVESVSARLLTTDLFRRQVRDPILSRAEALRQTMLTMLDEGVATDGAGRPRFAYAHPLFWAPFSLIGDGGR